MTAGGVWVAIGLVGMALTGWPGLFIVACGLVLLFAGGKPRR